MNRILTFLLLLSVILFGCIQNSTLKNQTGNVEDSIPIDIYGKWYYSEYTDSTIKYKKIFDYSWTIASFAYEISINRNNPDSVIFLGYHERWTGSLKKISEYLYHAGEGTQYWILTFSNDKNIDKLEVKEYRDSSFKQKADPTIYTLFKKTIDIDKEELYFAKHIIAGEYFDTANQKTFLFKENLELVGFDSMNKYSIQIDPWEMVPQMDIIEFFNDSTSFRRTFNWQFEGNKLILRNTIPLYDDGERTGSDVINGDYAGSKRDTIVYILKKIR